MNISPSLYAETNTWGEPEPVRWINKDFVTVSGSFCAARATVVAGNILLNGACGMR